MRNALLVLMALTLFSCYETIEIPGLDINAWNKIPEFCGDTRVEEAEIILENKDAILGKGQALVKQAFGPPAENELYRRNQKFFYYELTAGDSCAQIVSQKRLSIRFDALDRAKEILIIDKLL